MKNVANLIKGCILTIPLAIGMGLSSCSSEEGMSGFSYDPSKPLVLESFEPATGPLATQVILTGRNFGNNADSVEVYFNEKKAPVITAANDKMLVLAPKLPGEDCVVTVKIGNQSAAFDQHFEYIIQTNVTTVVGGDKNASNYPLGGESLAEVQFNTSMNRPIAIDKENNIYFILAVGEGSNPDAVYVINEESDNIRMLESEITTFLNQNFIVYDENSDHCYRFHGNIGSNELYYYDRENDFARTQGGNINWPQNDQPTVDGMNAWSCKHQWAARPSDKLWYGRIDQGYFVSVDPKTGKATNLTGRHASLGFAGKKGECKGMAFDPVDDTKLYFSVTELNAILLYDFETDSVSVYAGSEEYESGHLDGKRLESLFNSPAQICIDADRNMYVADYNNNCIRKIVMETGYVSTVAGVPESAGYKNGTGDVAQFDHPCGLVVSQDGTLYVGDENNRAIRRIAIE